MGYDPPPGNPGLKERLNEQLARVNLEPETSAEKITLAAAASGKAIWLGLETPASHLEETIIRHQFVKTILQPIFQFRQQNKDITSIYEWTGDHGPYTQAEMQLIEKTLSLEKKLTFAEQMRPTTTHPDNNLRGDFLATLISALAHMSNHKDTVQPPLPLALSGAIISGPLDLANQTRKASLNLSYCTFEETLILNQARLTELSLEGCQCPGIEAMNAHIFGPTNLKDGFKCAGALAFDHAVFKGPFNANAAILSHPPQSGPAFSLRNATCMSIFSLGESFSVEGQIDFTNLKSHDDVHCNHAILTILPDTPNQPALIIEGADITGNLELGGNFSAIGSLYISKSRIGGTLITSGGSFQNPYQDGDLPAILIEDTKVDHHIIMQYANILGGLSLSNIQLGGNLNLSNSACAAKLRNGKLSALHISDLNIKGHLYMNQCAIRGKVLLQHTTIGKTLDCSSSAFENISVSELGETLAFENVTIGYSAILANGLNAKGHITFRKTDIQADLNMAGGHFEGDINLIDTKINGTLQFDQPGETTSFFNKTINLVNTKTGTLTDSKGSWPEKLIQSNFSYNQFGKGLNISAADRIRWLEKEGTFNPAAYDHLSETMKNSGQTLEAQKIARNKAEKAYWHTYEKTINRSNAYGVPPTPFILNLRTLFNWPPRAIYWLIYGWLWQYGLSASRMALSALLLIALGTAIYHKGEKQGLFYPQDPAITLSKLQTQCSPENGQSWTRCKQSSLPEFSPLLYSLDATLPFVDLKQTANWQPIGRNITIDLPTPSCFKWAKPCLDVKWRTIKLSGWSLSFLLIVQTFMGWLIVIGLGLTAFKALKGKKSV